VILKDGTRVRPLKDRYGTGYAGFGYGGDKFYVVCLVDCSDPPRYLVRADSWEQAYDTAIECLAETVEDGPYFEQDHGFSYSALVDGTKQPEDSWLTYSPSGRVVSIEDDIRCDEAKR
jgi:hypothetical protein